MQNLVSALKADVTIQLLQSVEEPTAIEGTDLIVMKREDYDRLRAASPERPSRGANKRQNPWCFIR